MTTEFSIVHWTGKAPEPVRKAPKPKVAPPAPPVVAPAPEPVTVDAASLFRTITPPEPEIPPISAAPVLPPIDDDLPPIYSKPVEQDALSRTTDPLTPTETEAPAVSESVKTGRGRRTYRSGRGT